MKKLLLLIILSGLAVVSHAAGTNALAPLGHWSAGNDGKLLIDHSGQDFKYKSHHVGLLRTDKFNALDFNGKDSYIEINFPPSLTSFSFSAWVNARGPGSIICRPGFHNSIGFNGKNFQFECWSVNDKQTWLDAVKPSAAEFWHQVTGVFDPVEKKLKIYVDGKPEGVSDFPEPLRKYGKTVYLGCSRPTRNHFNGLIADVKIYGRSLTAEEVKQDFESSRSRYPQTKLKQSSGLPPVIVKYKEWLLEINGDNGSWRKLRHRGEELICNNADLPAISLRFGQRNWFNRSGQFCLKSWKLDDKKGVLTVITTAGNWTIEELIEFDAQGRSGRIGRSARLTFRSSGSDNPAEFHELTFNNYLPKSGRYFVPATFLGDTRGIREVENDAQSEWVGNASSRSGECAALPLGKTIIPSAYVMPLLLEQKPSQTLVFLCDERRDAARQELVAAEDHLNLQQKFFAAGWAYPGVTHEIGTAYLELCPEPAEKALRDTVRRWYDEIGLKVPGDRPDWVYDTAMFEFRPSYCSSVDGFNAAGKELLPRLEKLGFNGLWIMPVQEGFMYQPRDYFKLDSQLGTTEEYRKMVETAHRLGFKVWQDIVPHGSAPALAQARGNSALALTYHYSGQVATLFSLDFKSPEWQDYMRRVAEFYMKNYRVDGFRIDMCGGSPTNWRKKGFPASDKPPVNIDPTWWKTSLAAVGGEMPPLPYLRGSLTQREGGLEMIRTIRQATRKYNPTEGAVLAEVSQAPYMQEGDAIYDFMYRLSLFKFREMAPGDYAVALSRWLEEQKYIDPAGTLRFRYIENHDGIPALSYVGLGAGRALTAIPYLTQGIPLVYYGFDLGNGVFLRRLNDVRKSLPELRRGEAFYQAVKVSPKSVFTVLRQMPGKITVGAVNLSSQPVDARLELPDDRSGLAADRDYTLWNAFTGEKINTGKIAALKQVAIKLAPWEIAILCWRPAAEKCPVLSPNPSVPQVSSHSAGKLSLTENDRFLTVTGDRYRLAIDRTSGLISSFADAAGNQRLGMADIILARQPEQSSAPVITVQQHEREIIVTVNRAIDRDGIISLVYRCTDGAVRIDTALKGHFGGAVAGLVFTGPKAERYQINTFEGILDDWYQRPAVQDEHLMPYLHYANPRQLVTPVLWQSELQMLNPRQPVIRYFDADGIGVEFTVNDLLKRAPANTVLYKKLGSTPGLATAFYWRQPGPLTAGMPERFSITLRTIDLSSRLDSNLDPIAVGQVKLANESTGWVIENSFYRIRLQRLGGVIRDLVSQRQPNPLIMERQDLYSDNGFTPAKRSFIASGKFDFQTGTRIWQDGDVLRMRFLSTLRGGNRYNTCGVRVWCLIEYAFSGADSFRTAWSISGDNGLLSAQPFLAWTAANPAWNKMLLSDNGKTVGECLFGGKQPITVCSGKMPGEIIIADRSGKAVMTISELNSSAPASGSTVQVDGNRILLTVLNKVAEFIPRHWYSTSCIITPGTVAGPKAPTLALPTTDEKTDAEINRSFEIWGNFFLLGEKRNIAFQWPTAAPNLWGLMSDAVRFDTASAGQGKVSLRLSGSDAIRVPLWPSRLQPGKYRVVMAVKGEKLAAATPLAMQLFRCTASGQMPGTTGRIKLSGTFDWKTVGETFEVEQESFAPALRIALNHAVGTLWIDDIRLEKQ